LFNRTPGALKGHSQDGGPGYTDVRRRYRADVTRHLLGPQGSNANEYLSSLFQDTVNNMRSVHGSCVCACVWVCVSMCVCEGVRACGVQLCVCALLIVGLHRAALQKCTPVTLGPLQEANLP